MLHDIVETAADASKVNTTVTGGVWSAFAVRSVRTRDYPTALYGMIHSTTGSLFVARGEQRRDVDSGASFNEYYSVHYINIQHSVID